MILEDNNL